MNNTSFLRNISKATNKNDLINNFAKNFGLKEIIDLRPQKQVIKKLNAENKKIQKKINAQLFDLMQERKKVNEFIGDRDNEITSLEELNLVKRRASMTKLSKKKKKFSTINPKKKIDIFPSNTKFLRNKTEKDANLVIKKDLIPIQDKVKKDKEANIQITMNNEIKLPIEKKSSFEKQKEAQNISQSIFGNKHFSQTQKIHIPATLFSTQPKNKKTSNDISLLEKIQSIGSPKNRNKKILPPIDDSSLISVKSNQSKSPFLSSTNHNSSFLLLNHQTDETKTKLSFDNTTIDSTITNKNIISKKELEHEKFRVLEKRNSIDDSLSYSEGNAENYLDFDESDFAIDPDCVFKIIWDYFIFIIVIYYLTMYSFFLAYQRKLPISITVFNIIFDIVFIVDLFLNFFVAFYTFEEELVRNLKLIAREYLNSVLFIIDLITAIPFGIILTCVVTDRETESYLNLLLFIKLFKVWKLMEDSSNRNYFNFLFFNGKLVLSSQSQYMYKFLLIFLLISHCISCLWIYLGNMNPGDNWIIKCKILDEGFAIKYLTSLYFHWVSIFTIGYGDVLASNLVERIYNCLLLFVGILIYSFTISSLGSMLTSRDEVTSKYEANINYLEELRSKNHIPDNFYVKLVKHLDYNLQYNKTEKYAFINDLPNRIKIQLLADMHKDLIQHCSFFKEHPIEYATKVVNFLKPICFTSREKIIAEGEYIVEIYFIRRGVISVLLDGSFLDKKVIDLRKNEYFGDILVEANQRCPFNLKVSSKKCDILLLKKEDFNVIKEEFPEELSESLIVSYYNYQSLLDLAEKKKNKIAEEINKWKKEDYSDDLSSLNNSSSKEGRISIASKSYITNGSKKKVNIPIITISSAEVPETTKIETPKQKKKNDMPTQITNLSFKEDKDNASIDSMSRRGEQNITLQKQLNIFGISSKKNKNSSLQKSNISSPVIKTGDNNLNIFPINSRRNNLNITPLKFGTVNKPKSSKKLAAALLNPNSSSMVRKRSLRSNTSKGDINFNLIIQNNNYYQQQPFVNSPRFGKTTINRANSIQSIDAKKTDVLPTKLEHFPVKNMNRRMSCMAPMLPKNELLAENAPVLQNSKKRHKLKEIDIEKFQKSEMFIRNMMENKKNLKQLENDPHQFFLDGMKNMLSDCVENENKQNEELIELFEKLCQKYDIQA